MPNINQFKNAMQLGGARPNHFRVTLQSPTLVERFDTQSRFLCKAASLPASTVGDIPVMYRGREVHFAGERTFAPWTITVINEVDFRMRDRFDEWLNFIQHNRDTSGREPFRTYQTQLKVEQLSRHNIDLGPVDTVIRTYYFHNAYPIDVGEIALSYDQPNMIEEFPVTFVYDFFTYDDR